jgi:tetratricopeptide (TPR) repeat protein
MSELQKYTGYYDRHSAYDMDYRQFMEKQAMVKDIGTSIQKSADQQLIGMAVVGSNITSRIDQSTARLQSSMVRMQTGIQTSIQAQTFAIVATQAALARTFQAGFDKVNNTLDMGFSGISNQLGTMTAAFSAGLDRVADNIKQMSKAICDRLDAIHDIVNNPLLTQSRELYRRAVVNYSKGFFEEALEDIKAAVEKSKTDYISWFLLGKVYLFGASEFSNVIDLDKAIEAFTTAAKYISPDIAASEDAKRMAAEIWFYLGLAKYNKHNDLNFNKKEAEAKEFITASLGAFEKSWGYSDTMAEARYNTARCKVLMGNTAEALKDLEAAITLDRGYCIKAPDDRDFESIVNDIYALIERMKKAIYPQAKADFDALTAKLADTVFLGGSSFAEKVKSLIDIWFPETFSEDMPYFDVLDGSIVFPQIKTLLSFEDFPCDLPITDAAELKKFGQSSEPQNLMMLVFKSQAKEGQLIPLDKADIGKDWQIAVKNTVVGVFTFETGLICKADQTIFLPLKGVYGVFGQNYKETDSLMMLMFPNYIAQKNLLLFYNNSSYISLVELSNDDQAVAFKFKSVIKDMNGFKTEDNGKPFAAFKPGIISKSEMGKIEAEAKKAAEEAKAKAEQAARQAREAEEHKEQERREAEQRRQWERQGLCRYCGGKLAGLFTKKCKSCGREN